MISSWPKSLENMKKSDFTKTLAFGPLNQPKPKVRNLWPWVDLCAKQQSKNSINLINLRTT